MNNAGLMRIGAMLAVLAVLAGTFATLPSWTASAANKTVWGLVDECGSQGPSYLQNVNVILTDAHTGTTLTNSTWRDGSFSFSPAPGSYTLRFQLADHYTKDYPAAPAGSAFRFDGSLDRNINICLEKMPTRDSSLTVYVVDQTSSAHMGDPLTSKFSRTFFSENIATAVDTGTGLATVTHHPVVRPGDVITWQGATSFTLQTPVDYGWMDPFAGVVEIRNTTVLTSLQSGTSGKNLIVSYQYSGTRARLSFYPVVPGSYSPPRGDVRKNASTWPAGPDWTLDENTGWFTVNGNFIFGTDSLTIDYSSTGAVSGATVNIYNTTKKQVVAQGSTNASGAITLAIWKDSSALELQVQKEGYQPFAALINTAAFNTSRVTLLNGVQVFGIAFRAGGSGLVTTNVVGFLYNTDPTVFAFKKIISAKVSGALYIFYAEAGQYYKMVIDADGYRASESFVSTAAGTTVRANVTLTPSLKEEYLTDVRYGADWNVPNISRKLTLRSDSTIPGLELAGIRSVALQIDYANYPPINGDRNGNLSGLEISGFRSWLQNRLADYVTTDGFLTTNGVVHNSTSYPPLTVAYLGPVTSPTTWFVNSTATYNVAGTARVPIGKSTYTVNITTPNDTNTTQYKDQIMKVTLPPGYEMTSKKVTGSITTTGWTVVTVDPGQAVGTSRIDMTVQKSANGTARAMVEKPTGKFHVLDDALKNYTVVVAAGTNITFSANQSTDPVGNIRDSNFTWEFTNRSRIGTTGYNITAVFNYTTAILNLGHSFVVNLTVVEAGGNHTYRNIKVFVDDTPPVAMIKLNRTGTVPANTPANDSSLKINEDIPIKFDATLSTDKVSLDVPAWVNAKDTIPDTEGSRGYRWDFDANNITDSNLVRPVKVFDKPGWYNTTLQVVDWVGHKNGLNATIHITVNDTTKPTPNFVILDPSNEWVVTTTLVEGKEYTFNASSSSDNLDDSKNLTYHWHFPGPVNGSLQNGWYNGTGPGRLSWNITVKWTAFNLTYNVTLNVTDRGFRAVGDTPKPNTGNRTTSVAVSVDVTKHPDLKYVAASLKVEPAQPEEGQLINVSFMIENAKSRANATNVRVLLTAKDSNGAVVLQTDQAEWRDANWTALGVHSVDSGKRVRLTFRVSFPAQGNKTLSIHFNDTVEPYTWDDSQNKVTGSVFVKLAGWVLPAAIIGIIALIAGAAIGLRTYSRYKSGELVFRKKEKPKKKKLAEKEDEEEEEPEEEEKVEKKRL